MEFRRNRLFRNVATPHFRRQGQCPHHAGAQTFCRIEVGSVVNLEFDIVGKYIARLMQNYMK